MGWLELSVVVLLDLAVHVVPVEIVQSDILEGIIVLSTEREGEEEEDELTNRNKRLMEHCDEP